jgi:hypothetical protein
MSTITLISLKIIFFNNIYIYYIFKNINIFSEIKKKKNLILVILINLASLLWIIINLIMPCLLICIIRT